MGLGFLFFFFFSSLFFTFDLFWDFKFLFLIVLGGKIKHRCRLFRSVITFMYNDFIFICLASFFSLCVLPTTIGSESTNCDDPYQWYTMHREIKFVMIPDGSSTAPAYSLWKTLLSPFPFVPMSL